MSDGKKIICVNRKARHDYHIESKIEAGIQLKGSEVKSCRDGRVQLVDSFATLERGEMYMLKSHIAEYKQGGPFFNHEPVRKRKLLLKKKEIERLARDLEQKGFSLIPLQMYFRRGYAKVELGLAKGKSKGDKRQSNKKAEADRKMDAARKRDR